MAGNHAPTGRRPPLAPLALAALRLRCPVCRDGRVFASWFHMAPQCPRCTVSFEREEGFFVGAIYVGYAVTLASGALLLAAGLAAGWPWGPLLAAFVVMALVLPLLTWRHSRAVWLALDQYLDPRSSPLHVVTTVRHEAEESRPASGMPDPPGPA